MRKELMFSLRPHLEKLQLNPQYQGTHLNGPCLTIDLVRPALVYFNHGLILTIDGIKFNVSGLDELVGLCRRLALPHLHATQTLIDKFKCLPLGNGLSVSGVWFEENAPGVWIMHNQGETVNMTYADVESALRGL